MDIQQSKTEIIVKAVSPKDNKSVGPSLGICDREGTWYNTKKSDWAKFPGAWETLTSLAAGERLELTYERRPWSSKTTGKSGTSLDIVGFEKIQRTGDEVVRPQDAKPSVASSSPVSPQVDARPVQQEWSPKQTCIKSATDIVVALWNTGQTPTDLEADILARAKRIYAGMKETW